MRPLTGPLDCRSNPEDAPPLSFRMKLNFDVDKDDKLSRSAGWEKLLSKTPYANQDAHDQGDCFDVFPVREPITFLYEATTNDGTRRLVRGTQSKVAILNEGSGNWDVVGRGFGGSTVSSQIRWSAGQSGNTMVFTNGYDKPQKYTIGTIPGVCGANMLAEIAELNDLKISRAGVVASFSGCVFLMDVTQEGTRVTSRVRWSGVNRPLVWKSGDDTVANYQDLPYTETILAASELQGNLVIFTDKSIYRCFVAGTSFGFTRVYTEPRGLDKCIAYPKSLVSDGNSLWWLGRDGFYRWDVYSPEPVIAEWLYRSETLVMNDLDPTCCEGPVGEYWPDSKTIFWSWPKSDSSCIPHRTIKANLRANTVSLVDHGFTAFSNYRSDLQQSLQNWLDEFCGTDLDNLCIAIGTKRIDDFCQVCNQTQLFIAACSDDFCIKQIGTAYSREVCTNAASGFGGFGPGGDYVPFTGQYTQDGYFSVVRGMFPLGFLDKEKSIKNFLMEPTVQDLLGQSNYWRLRIGTSYQARDANVSGNPLAFAYLTDGIAPTYEAEFATDGGDCEVIWRRMSDKPIQCPDTKTVAQYIAQNIRPVKSVNWVFLEQGRFLYYELSVITKNEADEVVPPVGAVFTISRFAVEARVLSM